jgi:hypothetical protein
VEFQVPVAQGAGNSQRRRDLLEGEIFLAAPGVDDTKIFHQERLPPYSNRIIRTVILSEAKDPVEERDKNRAGGIRTRDLLNPIQAHYQAVLRPEGRTIRPPLALAKCFYRHDGGNERGAELSMDDHWPA